MSDNHAVRDLDGFRRLLKELWRCRAAARGRADLIGRLAARARRNALISRLDREWPGGAVVHETGDAVWVPHPLDARGRACLLNPPHAHPLALHFLETGSIAIDVGANLGEWALPLARAVGRSGRLYAFEPWPRAAAALRRSFVLNNLVQGRLIECAVSNADGRASLAVPIVTSSAVDGGRSRLGAANPTEEAIEVTAVTLDGFCAAEGLQRLDLLKIDVEGHERAVLKGAAATIRRLRPVIIIETGHEGPGDCAGIAAQLGDVGYELAGILLDYGLAPAEWDAYAACVAPFAAGQAHNLLLLPPDVSGAAS
jgi:FkbM family methyltransferase